MDLYRITIERKVLYILFRTENSVKNKFYGFVRKFIRTMNRYIS
jgi:hypothetical protein